MSCDLTWSVVVMWPVMWPS